MRRAWTRPTIEKKGTAPLAPQLERINGVKTKADLIKVVAYMHQNATPALFAFYPQPDMHDSNATIAYIDQGGITLPDRDYYIKDDARSVETRQKYLEHVQKMFELAGDQPEVAAAEAKTVLAVETGPGPGLDGPHAAARSQDPRPQDDGGGDRSRRAEFRSHGLLREQRLAEVQHAERGQSRLLQAGQRTARQRVARRLEDLPALEGHQRPRPDADQGFCGRGLPVQRQVSCRASRRWSRAGSAA